MIQLGLIGNCAFSALIHHGRIVWLCWPRFDSSFVFGSLLDEERGGAFDVEAVGGAEVTAEYVENTNILRTEFRSESGTFELIDFAPRFQQYSRYFKPTMVVRILRPIDGNPMVRVRCRPVGDYGQKQAAVYTASNHLEYAGLDAPVRLTTNLPLTYVADEQPFVLTKDAHLVLTWGQPLESGLEEAAERFLQRTTDYWRRWVKHTRIPRDYQQPVIRSALAIKLHQYEDTGAIIAATTTSLPEYPGSTRNWDYRYCWLRDAYFSLNALERLGHTEEMERFLLFLRNLCERYPGELQPLFAINGDDHIEERILEHLDGFRGERPVRIGNQAYEHVQNDVYGEMVLGVSRMLLDVRFGVSERSNAGRIVGHLLDQIEQRMDQPDAGLWELRDGWQLHGFTLLTHWAGATRAAEIGEALGDEALRSRGQRLAGQAHDLLRSQCFDEERGVLTQAAGKKNLDAAMLLALHFGYLKPGDPLADSHVDAIRKELSLDGGLLRRYAVEDDFGYQEAAFTVCSFWLAEALAIVGRTDEARELFEKLLSLENGLGLYSEDILPGTNEQSGNFPQTYSHVGLINAAFRLSRDWSC